MTAKAQILFIDSTSNASLCYLSRSTKWKT